MCLCLGMKVQFGRSNVLFIHSFIVASQMFSFQLPSLSGRIVSSQSSLLDRNWLAIYLHKQPKTCPTFVIYIHTLYILYLYILCLKETSIHLHSCFVCCILSLPANCDAQGSKFVVFW